jgi:nicotinate-nucleotide--dimethylbenzimidazole phosphoribosyltransferase
LDDAGLAHKLAVLQQADALHAAAAQPLDLLARLGGLDIAALVGAALQAGAERRVIVVDGYICTAAIAVAAALAPPLLERCVFAHASAEPGHRALLAHLRAQPLLDLGLRLGEGSGAALAWPLLESATRLLDEMASFDSAQVSQASGR